MSHKTGLESEKRMRREIANSNERRRMQSINAGFQLLRSLLPHNEGEKLSKVRQTINTCIGENLQILSALILCYIWLAVIMQMHFSADCAVTHHNCKSLLCCTNEDLVARNLSYLFTCKTKNPWQASYR